MSARRKRSKRTPPPEPKIKKRLAVFAMQLAGSIIILALTMLTNLISPKSGAAINSALCHNTDLGLVTASVKEMILKYSPAPEAANPPGETESPPDESPSETISESPYVPYSEEESIAASVGE